MTLDPSHDARLVELADLRDGWLDGEGKAIGPECIAAAREFLSAPPHLDAADPYWPIFPTVAGGVLLERHEELGSGTRLISVEFEPGLPVNVFVMTCPRERPVLPPTWTGTWTQSPRRSRRSRGPARLPEPPHQATMLRSLPQDIVDSPTTLQAVALRFTRPVEGHLGFYLFVDAPEGHTSPVHTVDGFPAIWDGETRSTSAHPGLGRLFFGIGFVKGFEDVFEDAPWFEPTSDMDITTWGATEDRNLAEGRVTSGVADSIAQVLDRMPWLTADEQAYAVTVTAVNRSEAPDFRWEHQGPYIGDFANLPDSGFIFVVQQYRDGVVARHTNPPC